MHLNILDSMKHNLHFVFIICILLSSCRRNSESSTTSQDEFLTQYVTFSSTISSRVSGGSFDVGDEIHVTSFNEGELHTEDADYIYQGDLTFTSATPIEISENQSLTYIASYPPQVDVDSSFDFTVSSDQSSQSGYVQSDLLIAVESSMSTSPTLDFDHTMSHLVVKPDFKYSDGATPAISDFRVYGKRAVKVECSVSTHQVSVETTSQISEAIVPYNSLGEYMTILAPSEIYQGDLMATVEIDGELFEWRMSESISFESNKQYSYTWSVEIYEDGSSTSSVDYQSNIGAWDDTDISTDSQGDESIALQSVLLDKSNFSSLSLAGDATYLEGSGYGNICYAFDGINELLNYNTDTTCNGALASSSTGKTMSFDLGGDYVLTNYTFWQRLWDKIYDQHNIKSFRLWGASSAASEDGGLTLSADYQLTTSAGVPDFTSMGDKWEELVYESAMSAPTTTAEQESAALQGHSYTITSGTTVRYLRLELLGTWSNGTTYYLSEIDLSGVAQ